MKYIAHAEKRENGQIAEQRLVDHLIEAAKLAGKFAGAIGLELFGEVAGLLHDLAKFSIAFQLYIRSAVGILTPEDPGYIHAERYKGKIDHSTAGAQYLWQSIAPKSKDIAQILALCCCSHHGGLIDCLDLQGELNFLRRMNKKDTDTHYEEAFRTIAKENPAIMERIDAILSSKELTNSYSEVLKKICQHTESSRLKTMFYAGLLIRFIFSCLIDADRINTAKFACGEQAEPVQKDDVNWDRLIEKLDTYLTRYKQATPIEKIRHTISEECFQKAMRGIGIFTLTVPTGGGKTLASLRFALHHAKKHKLKRIIYVIPYLSILDQNAKVAKDIFEAGPDESAEGKTILEYHSNIIHEERDKADPDQLRRREILEQSLDSPIIFTTSVHLLNVIAGGKTSDSRHFHQLADSVIIFDEIQTLPVKCTHIFCNAINFLTQLCGSSVMLCTATQPALGAVDRLKGNLNLTAENEIVSDIDKLFHDLKRVEVRDKRKPGGWSFDEIAQEAYHHAKEDGSALTIVNTKIAARKIYRALKQIPGIRDCELFHLSTNMCAAHRMAVLEEMRSALQRRWDGETDKPILCVSTQLIEAGVDVDFAFVMRSVAGLDSIAQAAGRCNRNGLLKKYGIPQKGIVYIINLQDEKTDSLEDIRVGKEKAIRILDAIKSKRYPELSEGEEPDLLSPGVMKEYFYHYFYERKSEMVYPVKGDERTPPDDLLNILSENKKAKAAYRAKGGREDALGALLFKQAFDTASKHFQPIDQNTRGVIVPYESRVGKTEDISGKAIIAELCSINDVKRQKSLLQKAQRYAVNINEATFQKLYNAEIIFEVQEGAGIYALKEEYYSGAFGLSTEQVSDMTLLDY